MRAAAALALAVALLSCADERPTIDRVQPNAVQKSFLQGEWYAQQTVVEVPATVTTTFVGDSQFPAMSRIRWDIQEDVLYARRSYELVQNSDADNGDVAAGETITENGQPYQGAILAAYRIESHFDIRHEYNPTTGEELNIIVENSQDRPWYEREYMRVDWSENLATDFSFFVDDEADVASVPYFIQENDPNEDDRPHFAESYFDITTQLAVTPGSVDVDWYPAPVPMCWFFYHEQEDCSTTIIKVRNSYLRVDPSHQYEPMVYDGKLTEAFGFFDIARLHQEQHNGVRETDRRRLINRHNLWQRWYDDQNDPIPYAEREVRPMVYYLNEEWPTELREVAMDVADEWNVAFRDVVKAQTGWADDRTPDVFILCPNNPVKEGDRPECGPAGTRARVGDIRYSFLYWVKDWYDGWQLLGLGPSNADPLTGEIISGMAYIFLYNDQVATDVEEMVRLLNGEISPTDYIDGVDLGRWVEATGEGEQASPRVVTPEEVASMRRAMDVGWTRSLPRGDGRWLPPGGMGRSEAGRALSALQRTGAFDPSRDPGDALLTSLRGTPIESMLVNDEILMAAGQVPGTPLSDEILDRASITRSGLIGALRGIDRFRTNLGRRGIDVAEMVDDAQMGLAQELRGKSSDEIWQAARERIVHAVAAHEIGHSVGLMHNFGGSEDVFNYDPTYWELRTNGFTTDPQPRYIDPITPEQISGSIYNYAYSSVMDYAGRLTIDGAGIGRYDRAAVMYGYAGLVEAFENTGAAQEADLSEYWSGAGAHLRFMNDGPRAFHYTEWYRLMGDLMWRDDNRRLVPVSELTEDLAAWESPETGERLVRVPYVYCSHNRVDISENCLTRDVGADPYERMVNGLQALNTWYVTRAFTRSEYGFAPERYIARTYGRHYDRLKGFNDIYALYNGLLPTLYSDEQIGEFFTDPDVGWGNFTVAIHDAFNQLARTLTMPDVNDYRAGLQPDGTRALVATGFGGGVPLDVTQGRYFTTAWWDSSYDDDCGYYFWECLHHVGFYLDKVMALLAMSDAQTYFVARDTAEDIREWRISFYDDFATQITDLVGGILSQDYADIAPYLEPESGTYLERDHADPELDAVTVAPVEGASPVDPFAGFTVQLYAAVLGAARMHNNFDYRFDDALRMWIAGNGHSVSSPTVSYTDPTTGFTYLALDLPNGVAARVIARANLLRSRSPLCNDEDDEAPDACVPALPSAQRESALGALQLLKSNLDILVDLTGHMDSMSDGYGDPFDPGGSQ
ncbi:MAG: zinc-dependent metalloprotease [Deltaproteobacteria bacterium]|nr:zinc-dependent metalloprotease [Deltaproteobacteria bacterium]